jgi:Xaa-Pro aminopeptidase
MAIHFTQEEFHRRKKNTLEQMERRGLDGLLMFRQESMYYLTGYDSLMILMDSDSNHAMCFGYTVLVNETGCEFLSHRPFDLIVK